MPAKELRDQSLEELEAQRRELAQELFGLRCERSARQVEKPHLLRAKRRERARVLTILAEKKRAERSES